MLAWASWAMPEHASSMARPTADGNLTVYEHEEGDAGVRLAAAAHLPVPQVIRTGS